MMLWPEKNKVHFISNDKSKIGQYETMLEQYGIFVVPVLPEDVDISQFDTKAEFANALKIAKEAYKRIHGAVLADLTEISKINNENVSSKMHTSLVYIDDNGDARGYSGTVYGNIRENKYLDSEFRNMTSYPDVCESEIHFKRLYTTKSISEIDYNTAFHCNSSGIAISKFIESIIDDHFLKTSNMPMKYLDILESCNQSFSVSPSINVCAVLRQCPTKSSDKMWDYKMTDVDIIITKADYTHETIDGKDIKVSAIEGYDIREIFRLDPISIVVGSSSRNVYFRDQWSSSYELKRHESGLSVCPVINYCMDNRSLHDILTLCTNHTLGRKLAFKLHLLGITEIMIDNIEEYDMFSKILGAGGMSIINLNLVNTNLM